MGLGPCGLERKAGRGLGLGACLRPRRLDRTRRRGAAVNANAARALVPLFEAGNCGRRLEQSSDERAKGRRGEGLGGASRGVSEAGEAAAGGLDPQRIRSETVGSRRRRTAAAWDSMGAMAGSTAESWGS